MVLRCFAYLTLNVHPGCMIASDLSHCFVIVIGYVKNPKCTVWRDKVWQHNFKFSCTLAFVMNSGCTDKT